MSLFKKVKKAKDPVSVDKARAQELYGMFADGLNETRMFIDRGVPFGESKIVMTEMCRLEAEVMSKMSGNYITIPGTPAVYDPDTGDLKEEEIPPTYFKVTTQKALSDSIKSTLLDVSTLLEDVIQYHPDYDPKRKWHDFEGSFEEEM